MAEQATLRLNPYLPWLDHGGRVSPFKTAVFMLLFLPGLYVAWQLATHGYARPYILANHDLGDWAIRLLFLALAVTPLRQSLGLPKLIQVRRMVGVAAFCYALAHFVFFALDKSLQIGVVAREIALRYYLTIGFVGLLILLALAATSTDGMIRRMGGKKWAALHRLVYGAGALALDLLLERRGPGRLSYLFARHWAIETVLVALLLVVIVFVGENHVLPFVYFQF